MIRLKEAAETKLTISMADINDPKINVSQSTSFPPLPGVRRLPGDHEIRTSRTSWLLLMDSANKGLLPDVASSQKDVCPEETQHPHGGGVQILIERHSILTEVPSILIEEHRFS